MNDGLMISCLNKDAIHNEKDKLYENYRQFIPVEPLILKNIKEFFVGSFNESQYYNLY
jgi:hypothetical protein